jgi:mRNA interferase MazF
MGGSDPGELAGLSARRRGFPKYGEIYQTELDPVVGAEMAKRRPALIVSNDENNEFAALVTVIPPTSAPAARVYPFEVALPRGTGGLRDDSRVKANQIRTVDKSRLKRYIGTLPADYLEQVQNAIRVHLNLR